MTSASVTEAGPGTRSPRLAFAAALPAAVASRLDLDRIHLWRLAHARAERRAPLLRLLAGYLDVPPDAIALAEDAGGKPYIAGFRGRSGAAAPLDFNWSHSGPWALVALARGQPVGVDVEGRARPLRVRELARRFFDPSEAAALDVAGDAATRAFIGLWCAKEAVLKAAGRGLAFGLERIAFEHRGGPRWRLARVDPALGRLADWRLAGFEAAPGYRGALAWRGALRRIEAFELPAP